MLLVQQIRRRRIDLRLGNVHCNHCDRRLLTARIGDFVVGESNLDEILFGLEDRDGRLGDFDLSLKEGTLLAEGSNEGRV